MSKLKYHFFYGFSKRLFFSNIAIFMVTMLLFSSVVYYRTAQILKERIVAGNQETLDEAAHNIEQYMDDVELLTFNISTNSKVQNTLVDIHDRTDFEAVLETEELINQLLTVDVFVQKTQSVILFAEYQNKYPVYSEKLRQETGRSGKSAVCRADEVRDTCWYREAVDGRGQVIWKTSDLGNPVLMAVRGLLNTKNLRETIGVIRVVADQNRFKQVMEKMSFGDGSCVCMMAGDMILWGDTDGHPEVEEILRRKQAVGEYQVINGKKSRVIQSKLGESDWKLIGVFPENTMLNPYNVLKGILLPSLIMAFVFSLLLVQLNARKMSKPIQQVSEAMRHYDLNRTKRFETERMDEIGVLCRSYNRMMDHIDRLLIEVQETANRKRKAELQALQAQINPHFLYNTLDCIKNLAYLNDNQEIVSLTTSLSEFFRISLNKGSEILPLSRELDHVRSYCEILRFRNRVDFDLQINVPEILLNRSVIKLILQPLVENSIQHGFSRRISKGMITIDAREKDGYLILSVTDNGEGGDVEFLNGLISGEYRLASSGKPAYGIINVDERLRLTFGEHSGLRYSETSEGSIVAEIWIWEKEEAQDDADSNEGNSG